MATKKKIELPTTYGETAAELTAILDAIETGAADIDVLSERVERAAELIRACREKLTGAELRVKKIVEELAAETAERAGEDEEE
jgi:exodeoxyribonuclease VII small subunit